jgi:hypothetical protein
MVQTTGLPRPGEYSPNIQPDRSFGGAPWSCTRPASCVAVARVYD